MPAPAATGPIALVGSGEYLPQMDNIDRMLLEHVGGASARVVLLATAAGLEAPASPQRWARMGVEHFARLGARPGRSASSSEMMRSTRSGCRSSRQPISSTFRVVVLST